MNNASNGANRFYTVNYDLNNCDQEPIHIIRVVQSYACLLGVDVQSFSIIHVSDNSQQILGLPHEEVLSQNLADLLHPEIMEQIRSGLQENDFLSINPIIIKSFGGHILDTTYHLIAHLQDQTMILEFEQRDPLVSSSRFLQRSDRAVQKIQSARDVNNLFHETASEIKVLTGYDRVMIYQFDEEYNGIVIAEAKEDHLSPYYQLRYPASDIPRQARALFLRNQVRIIVDAQSEPAQIIPAVHPETGTPLDQTDSVARGVSPIHIEYLNNMGVRASMSVAIVKENKLWGLIACHHYQPKLVDYRVRNMIKFLSRIISGHLALQEAHDFREQGLQTNIVRSHLLEQMSRNWSVLEGLMQNKFTLLDLNQASGAALLLDGRLHTIGECPSEEKIMELIDWLENNTDSSVFETNELSAHWPAGLEIKDVASGLLSLQIAHTPPEYILWFRPEIIQTVNWGGNPEKAVTFSGEQMRLSPRKSFDIWKEQVQNTAKPWDRNDINSAIALRNDIKEIIIEKYQEIRKLNQNLLEAYKDLESFSYSVSHDLRMPLRTIEGFSQILEEDYKDKLDDYGQQVIQTISSSIGKMNGFINDLLALSKISLNDLIINKLNPASQIEQVWNSFPEAERQRVQFQLKDPMPPVYAEVTSLRQLLSNLLSNAIKYSRHQEIPMIEVGADSDGKSTVIYVRDNGIGMDPKHHQRIFDVFSRLVSDKDYEGTGVGLAIVKKVVDKHRGEVWVESEKGGGSTFYCRFPIHELEVL
ncbi:ATP-binding protein [Flavilitoribacter nigricans]|nr:ATP-binding protein [Flavilitoribacter nigricans]